MGIPSVVDLAEAKKEGKMARIQDELIEAHKRIRKIQNALIKIRGHRAGIYLLPDTIGDCEGNCERCLDMKEIATKALKD